MPFVKFVPEPKDDRCWCREHDPPAHIVLPPGTHTWECPECGAQTTFVVRSHTLLAEFSDMNKVDSAIRDYYFALDNREHGGNAAHNAISQIEEVLGTHWRQNEEKQRRLLQANVTVEMH